MGCIREEKREYSHACICGGRREYSKEEEKYMQTHYVSRKSYNFGRK